MTADPMRAQPSLYSRIEQLLDSDCHAEALRRGLRELLDSTSSDPSGHHRYHALFDSAATVGCDLALDEQYHPGAGDALTAWAAAHNRSAVPRYAAGWPNGALTVALVVPGTPGGRSIDVYLR